MRRLALGLAILTLGGLEALAGDLKAPFNLDSAQVLPKGVRNPRFLNVWMDVQNRWDGAGGLVPLGSKLNKAVTGDTVIAGVAREGSTKQASVSGLLRSAGLVGADVLGSTSGMVNSYADVHVPVLGMGITERWTAAVVVPILNIQVRADTGFIADAGANRFVNQASQAGSPVQAEEAKLKLESAIPNKLASLGYRPIQDETFAGIGDIQLVNKFQLVKQETQAFALKSIVTLPTGRTSDPDRVVDAPLGDGRWMVGAGGIYDRYGPGTDWRWSTWGTLTAQLPHETVKRIPASADDSLSADKESLVRTWGGLASVGSAITRSLPKAGLSVGVGYSYQVQTGSHYEGGQLGEAERYLALDQLQPIQELHSLTAVAGFSSVDWYKAGRFKIPLQANLTWSRPIAGRNVTNNDALSAELVLFF